MRGMVGGGGRKLHEIVRGVKVVEGQLHHPVRLHPRGPGVLEAL